MNSDSLFFTLWDVGHGLSIWVVVPTGATHWIDVGSTPEFSPSLHVSNSFGVQTVDYLIISHPDKDHVEDLPCFLQAFGQPRVLHRNKTLPEQEMFGDGRLDYQQAFRDLHTRFTASIRYEESPQNPAYNGGVEYAIHSLTHGNDQHDNVIAGNDTSLVVMLHYQGVVLICPGDIESRGWAEIWRLHGEDYLKILEESRIRILVAPHHGRASGYSKEMMNVVNPHAVIISDIWGESETHPAFRDAPLGINWPDGVQKFYSTKRRGRVQIQVGSNGALRVDQYDS